MKATLHILASLLIFGLIGTVYAQTPGINYQAYITNNKPIQIPGSDIEKNVVPLINEPVNFRFSITNAANENIFVEEQTTTTDEHGLVSLIIGEGVPILSNFNNIIWDGTPKFLNVELEIIKNNDGYVLIDTQKILYLPQALSGGTSAFVERQVLYKATQGQTQFQTPLPIVNIENINVFRNGVRIDCTQVNNTTIALEAGVVCYPNDEIRIVQFN